MNILDIFTTKPAAPTTPAGTPPQSTPGTGNQPPGNNDIETYPPNTDAHAANGTAPNGMVPATPETPPSPLDQYKDVWDTESNEAPAQFTPEQIDPTKLQEVMGKVDLTKTVTPEVMAAIQAGGEGATQAMMTAINSVSQQAMVQSTVVANKMFEDQLTKSMEAMESRLTSQMREQTLSNTLHEQNPIYSNPAIKPVIDAVKSNLALKNPNATNAELVVMAQDFVKVMGESFNPQEKPDTSKLPAGEQDWTGFELDPLAQP